MKVDYLNLNLQSTNLSKIKQLDNYLINSFNCRNILFAQSTKNKHTSEVKIVPIVYKRLDKIRLVPTKEMIPLIYLNAQHVYVNEKILKRLRAGDLSSNLVLTTTSRVVFIIRQLSGVNAFAILDPLGKINAPNPNPGFVEPGYLRP